MAFYYSFHLYDLSSKSWLTIWPLHVEPHELSQLSSKTDPCKAHDHSWRETCLDPENAKNTNMGIASTLRNVFRIWAVFILGAPYLWRSFSASYSYQLHSGLNSIRLQRRTDPLKISGIDAASSNKSRSFLCVCRYCGKQDNSMMNTAFAAAQMLSAHFISIQIINGS